MPNIISGMKISSKPRFDNNLLKRWLLKVGPVRRKTLLKKMTSKDTETRNRHRNNKIETKYSNENKEKDKNNNVDSYELDIDVNRERSSSEVGSRKRTENSKKSRHKSRPEKERRLREGENPNGIVWRLIPIDMVYPPKPPVSVALLQRHDAQKKKKKERLLAKFIAIFGEDDQDELDDTDSYLQISEARGTSTENDTVSDETESSYRKSPTFSDKGKKRKKTIRKEPVVAEKKLKTSNPSSSNQSLISESEQEPLVSTEPSMTSVDTTPPIRQQSVIFKVNKHHGEVVVASSTGADLAPQSESIVDEETASSTAADPALESKLIINQETASSTETDTFEAQAINSTNIAMSDDDTKDTIICSQNENVKNEPVDRSEEIKPSLVNVTDQNPLNIGAKRFSRNSLDYDPNPTSTTGVELGDPIGSETMSSSDRLLGALDNIFLALCCRRDVSKRQQTASKLAIKRNRQEEVLQAKQEFEYKMNVFRQELVYLSSRIGTWDGVLRFIDQGLKNRTPNGMKPFTKVEVDAAMREADLKLPSGLRENESSGIRKKSSVNKVICEIDLTLEIEDDSSVEELCCDSSTDPATSQDQKYEVHDVDEEDWKHGIRNVNSQFPSIAEVTTISPQQFETFGEKKYFTSHDDIPCLLCSRTSFVACSQCTKAPYCSKTCQELHWDQSHHATCKPLPGITRCGE